mmetsp:Transcript_19602/g.40283  ORF Transcript_19602/g.40283 Transcript_19602/m.40283 type:complete len:259 (+) Transcript_19602:431-1207(+)
MTQGIAPTQLTSFQRTTGWRGGFLKRTRPPSSLAAWAAIKGVPAGWETGWGKCGCVRRWLRSRVTRSFCSSLGTGAVRSGPGGPPRRNANKPGGAIKGATARTSSRSSLAATSLRVANPLTTWTALRRCRAARRALLLSAARTSCTTGRPCAPKSRLPRPGFGAFWPCTSANPASAPPCCARCWSTSSAPTPTTCSPCLTPSRLPSRLTRLTCLRSSSKTRPLTLTLARLGPAAEVCPCSATCSAGQCTLRGWWSGSR